jgi:hypothetical protein
MHIRRQDDGKRMLSTMLRLLTASTLVGVCTHAFHNFHAYFWICCCLRYSLPACRVKDTLKKVTGKGHEHEVSKALS